jgi:hypothetical protein
MARRIFQMRKIIAAAALTLLTAAALPSAAHASTRWIAVGSGFRVGPSHLSFVFGAPGPRLRSSYFVRFDHPVAYAGHHCTSACFREAGYYYHSPSCPVAVAHYHRYGADPRGLYGRYAPYVDSYAYGYDYGYGYDGYRYDRGYDRYDRGNRSYRGRNGYDGRNDHRYDRRDRGDSRGGRPYDGGRSYRGRGDHDRGGYDHRGRDDRGHRDARGRGGDRGGRGHGSHNR